MELFSHVLLSFFSKETHGLVRVNHCQLQQGFPAIHKDIIRMGYGSYMAELMNEMTAERVSHRELFEMAIEFFSILDTFPLREDYLRMFEMRLLVASGYRPCLAHCAVCRREVRKGQVFRFSIPRGGVVCALCSSTNNNDYPISLGTLKLFQQAYNLSVDKIQRLVFSSQAREESRAILPRFIQYHLGKELKTLKYFEKMRENNL